jgi:hypothetical protein
MISNRMGVINHLISKFGYSSYLEIGVRYGECIRAINCQLKHGVDPTPACPEVTYSITSDEFFANHCNRTYDIIFIDGHHDSEYVCRDLNNALKVLNPNGTIVMHDCYPGEKQFSVKMKDMSPGMMAWNGDGFKVVHAVVEKYCDELTTCVVDIDHGVGVIRKNKNAPMEIVYDDGYDFETLKAFPEEEINLISVQDFLEIFS